MAAVPCIQIAIAKGRDAATKQALVTQVGRTAAATGTPEDAFRVWVVEVNPSEVSVGGTVLANMRRPGQRIAIGEGDRTDEPGGRT
jgi:phenylpyruvate tautomerase PptA (4-oxalocrotonate tautomerase family)